jgi:hypothetical protein
MVQKSSSKNFGKEDLGEFSEILKQVAMQASWHQLQSILHKTQIPVPILAT